MCLTISGISKYGNAIEYKIATQVLVKTFKCCQNGKA